ncbi:MAG: ATP-binding cassette domain-containing protein, partial [Oligoflexales bacterium]|nr:ATP-binding cassette domain-containing protein [Oligoflexales bacterium]
MLIGPKLLSKRTEAAGQRRRIDETSLINCISENIQAQSTIKNFCLEAYSIKTFSRRNELLADSMRRFYLLRFLIERFDLLGVLLLQAAVLGIGAFMVSEGRMTVGTLLAFQGLYVFLCNSLTCVAEYIPVILGLSEPVTRIVEIMEENSHIQDLPNAVEMPEMRKNLVFKNVDFSHNGKVIHVKNVNLEILKNQFIAFVGPSGSGRSTILNLITRVYEPMFGSVMLDDHDIRKATLESYRKQIGVIAQENFIFSISIRENIEIGRLGATDQEIESAARKAEIHDFIMGLSEGYGTVVGEMGYKLSVEQRQRIALSRVLVRDPAIIVLDEATSALDPSSELDFNGTIENLRNEKTIISVTKRISTVKGYDLIMVMSKGELVERGTHDELIRLGGIYKAMWNEQSGFEISGDGYRATMFPEKLKAIPLFCMLDIGLLKQLNKMFVTEQYNPGITVIRQGDSYDKFYVIVRGRVDIVRTMESGKRVKLATLTDGDYFGEISLINEIPRTADVITAANSTFLSLRRNEFKFIMDSSPEVLKQITETYMQRMQEQLTDGFVLGAA